jgi:hypothetical protein
LRLAISEIHNTDHQKDDVDPNIPPFTQKKRACYIVLSDDDEPPVAKVITYEAKPAVNNEDSSLAASTKPSAGKKTPTGSRRPKAADYDIATHRILNTAINLYHVLLLTDNPFLDVQVELKFAKEAWDMSCEYYQSKNLSLDAGLISVVGDIHEFDTTYLMSSDYRTSHCCYGVWVRNGRWDCYQREKSESCV